MISGIRRHLSYANVVATMALVFAMSGAAVAANHYLIKSTSQISPKVLAQLKGKSGQAGPTGPAGPSGEPGQRGPAGPAGANGLSTGKGATGATGITGATGAAGPTGATGATGAAGPTGPAGTGSGGGSVATVFSASTPTPTGGLGSKLTKNLFTVAGNVEGELYCVSAFGTAMSIRVNAPEGSVADTGITENTTEGKTIASGADEQVVENVELFPTYGTSGGFITNLESTSAEPKAAVAHLTGAITTPGDVITLDAYMKSSAAEGCSVRGTAITTAR
jgi:hypothetical protein